MSERLYAAHTIPQEPGSWSTLLQPSDGMRMLSFGRDGSIQEIKSANAVEVISPEEKREIFGNDTNQLLHFLQDRDIPVPRDTLTDRLFVANAKDYFYLFTRGRGDMIPGSLGARLPNRLCLVNAEAVGQAAEQHEVPFHDLLGVVGLHEIAHTLTYQESWHKIGILNPMGGGQAFRRDGLSTMPSPKLVDPSANRGIADYQLDPRREGLQLLQEAMMQYIIQSSISPQKVEILQKTDPYADIVTPLEGLMVQLGEEPFIQGTFTRHGFFTLYEAVEKKYGEGSYNTLLTTIGTPAEQPLVDRLREGAFIE